LTSANIRRGRKGKMDDRKQNKKTSWSVKVHAGFTKLRIPKIAFAVCFDNQKKDLKVFDPTKKKEKTYRQKRQERQKRL
jgi:hypothetical protein